MAKEQTFRVVFVSKTTPVSIDEMVKSEELKYTGEELKVSL
jgi:hypothetical protein